MQEAITLHIQGLLEDHLPVPEPRALAEYVAVA
jgi:predicted RNase H-like HicB family nuclease